MKSQNLFLYLQILPASVRLIISKKGLWLRSGFFWFYTSTLKYWNTSSCHPSGCAYRQLWYCQFRQECWPFWYLSWWKKVQLKEDKTNPDIIPMVLVSIVQSKISYSWAPLISMFVNVNGLTSLPMKSSVMTGIYPNLTVHGSILSSFLF